MAHAFWPSAVILENKIKSLRVTLTYLLYRLFLIAALPLLLLYAAGRLARQPAWRRGFGERFGLLGANIPSTKPGGVWLHAVSVGEVLSAIPLFRELRRRYPDLPLFLSTTTVAGRAMAEDRLQGLADGIFWAPIDLVFAVRRVLRRLRPAMVLNLETELWPNQLREAKRHGAMFAQLNARISDRAWPRYEQLAGFFGGVLPQIDLLTAQSAKDAGRFAQIGYAGPVEQPGNLKFDFTPPEKPVPAEVLAWLERQEPKPLWVAASTMPPVDGADVDEDDVVLDAFAALGGGVRLVLVPRKPERFDLAAEKLAARGIVFARRSAIESAPDADVLLLDSMGELASLLPRADVVFVGGSMNRRGGHNILEPAYFGRPVLTGPHMQNFAAIQEMFLAAGAVRVVERPEELAGAVQELIANGAGLGEKGREVALSMRGSTARTVDLLHPLLEAAVPKGLLPLSSWTGALEMPWIWVSQRTPKVSQLPVPVISVGNLSMGGTGKTPLTLALAEVLERQGHRVGILTRGYGRADSSLRVYLPGQAAPIEQTGDEAQLYLRRTGAAVGIFGDRVEAGRALLARYPATVLLLDDGFQHRRLHRDLDLVMVDCLNPFPGFGVPPKGMLREPLAALGRANAFCLTRGRVGMRHEGLRALLRRYNPNAPVFALEVTESLSAPVPDPKQALAFCAIGNPASFRMTLDRMGLAESRLQVFDDHHAYTAAELDALRGESSVLVTTSKDSTKLPAGFAHVVVEQKLLIPDDFVHLLSTPKKILF